MQQQDVDIIIQSPEVSDLTTRLGDAGRPVTTVLNEAIQNALRGTGGKTPDAIKGAVIEYLEAELARCIVRKGGNWLSRLIKRIFG